MTVETKSIIDTEIDKMASKVVESVYLGLVETLSPNDPSFWDEHDKLCKEAQDYIVEVLNEEWV